MPDSIHSHTEWCILRYSHGKIENVRKGYKSAENARRGIPFVARADAADPLHKDASYTIASYFVGDAVARGGFIRYRV